MVRGLPPNGGGAETPAKVAKSGRTVLSARSWIWETLLIVLANVRRSLRTGRNLGLFAYFLLYTGSVQGLRLENPYEHLHFLVEEVPIALFKVRPETPIEES